MNQITKRGFTLIELLVVIAIIGILSSVVLASLNSARAKSRDARRVSDVKQMQNALELYYDANGQKYPVLSSSLAPTYIPVVPVDPINNGTYFYTYVGLSTDGTASDCESYHIIARLEASSSALNSDVDAATGTICTGSNADVSGVDGTGPFIYDVKP